MDITFAVKNNTRVTLGFGVKGTLYPNEVVDVTSNDIINDEQLFNDLVEYIRRYGMQAVAFGVAYTPDEIRAVRSGSFLMHGNVFPAVPVVGDQFFRDDLGEKYLWDGVAWTVTSSPGDVLDVGVQTSNKEAYDYIIAQGLDVGGLPREGANFWNSTIDVRRSWNGSIWVGKPDHLDSIVTQTIYVRTTGSDMAGDGTAVNPYLSIRQAWQDSAWNQNRELFVYDCHEAATFTIPNSLDTFNDHQQQFEGDPTWVVDGPYTVKAVLRDALDTANHGRRVTVNGDPWGTDQSHRRISILTGALAGCVGYVYDSAVAGDRWLQFDVGPGTSGSEPLWGVLAPGDTFQLELPSTTFDFEDPTDRHFFVGATHFVDALINQSTGFLIFESAGLSQITNCIVHQDGPGRMQPNRNTYLRFRDSYLDCDNTQAILPTLSVLELSGVSGISVLNNRGSDGPNLNSWGTRLTFGRRFVLAKSAGFGCSSNVQVGVSTGTADLKVSDGYWLRVYDSETLFKNLYNWLGETKGAIRLPQVVGDVSQYLILLNTSDMMRELLVQFLDGASVQTPGKTNRCSIDSGVSEGYFDFSRNIEIRGTGLDLYPVAPLAGSYTILDHDGLVRARYSTGAVNRTITLPDPTRAANIERPPITIKKVDAGIGRVIINGVVEGGVAASLVNQYDYVTVAANGTDYDILGEKP
jgi:hypothetical protein